MIQSIKQFILILIFLFPGLEQAYAQTDDESTSDSAVAVMDEESTWEDEPTDTIIRFYNFEISKDSIELYKRSKDFAYVKNLDSLLKLVKDLKADTINMQGMTVKKGPKPKKSNEGLADAPDRGPSIFANPVIKVILWILAGLFILFILYKLFFSQGFFNKDITARSEPGNEGEGQGEMMALSDFEKQILLAMQSGNYRLAVRYLYLQTLNKLSLAGHIQYTAEKTNYQYVRELYNKKYQNEFAALTLNYEYVWYGKFDIDQSVCNRLHTDFKHFHQKI